MRYFKSRFFAGVLGILNVVLLASWVFPWSIRKTLELRNVSHEADYCYVTSLSSHGFWMAFVTTSTDSPKNPYASKLQLLQDGKVLGPSHSLHSAIRELGGGRYSHWNEDLYFSPSDNLNPLQTRRVYEVLYPVHPAGWLIISGIISFLVVVGGVPWLFYNVLLPISFTIFGIAIFVLPIEFLLRSDYSKFHLLGVYGELPSRLRPKHNSMGYRDDDHQQGKVLDRVRIVILGDSMTYGAGLADDEIYPRLLGRLLGSKAEIISLARNGWSTADQLEALRREGLGYSPDIVVVAVVTNDPQPITTEPSGQQPQWIVLSRLPIDLDFFRFVDSLLNRYGDLKGWRYSYQDWERDIFDPKKRFFHHWQETVKELGTVLKTHGIEGYSFTMISPVTPSSPETIRKYETLTGTFANAGFSSINLHADFVREFGPDGGSHLWALPNDPHPGPAINQFFAREMAQVLEPRVRLLLANRRLRAPKEGLR